MSITVRVGGVFLQRIADVSGLEFSSLHRQLDPTASNGDTDSWSGDYQCSFNWAASAIAGGPHVTPGASLEVVDNGYVLWGGKLAEPNHSDVWDIHGYGHGVDGGRFQAIEDIDPTGTIEYAPTYVPNDALDEAIIRGSTLLRYADLGGDAIPRDEDEDKIITLGQVLYRRATALGKRWSVNSLGAVTLASDPTAATWCTPPDGNYMGTADENFITRLYGYYQSGLDIDDNPVYAIVYHVDGPAERKFGGPREAWVDLTALGLITEAEAQDEIDGRFDLVGGRMGWTLGGVLDENSCIRIGGGWSNPAYLRAGEMLRIPGVTDGRSQPTTMASMKLVLGEVRHVVDDRKTFWTPHGFAPRDFTSALAAAQKPDPGSQAA